MTRASLPTLGRWAFMLFLLAYPFLPFATATRGEQFTLLMIYALLALALNVILGYTGLLHMGIAAFFGIGAYTVAILSVTYFPFQWPFVLSALAAMGLCALAGIATTAPTLRLRGDYLALVTLGFGMITLYAIRNLESITGGPDGINGIEPDFAPGFSGQDLTAWRYDPFHWGRRWAKFPYMYYLVLGTLVVVNRLLRNLERSRLGRAWVALREDELATSCMGWNPARLKLLAAALAAALAGLAGAFFAVSQTTTGNPQSFDFTLSMTMVCCVILGGIGHRPGVILGVILLMGFDRILTPLLDNEIQKHITFGAKSYLKLSGWRLIIFGLTLIFIMRFRPAGLWPATRQQHELQPHEEGP